MNPNRSKKHKTKMCLQIKGQNLLIIMSYQFSTFIEKKTDSHTVQ